MSNFKTITLKTPANYNISATLYLPKTTNNRSIVISSATGVLQRYYQKFATHFSMLGYTVYTFDYYGIGKSSSDISTLKNNTYDLVSWGKNDQATVVKYAKDQNPEHKITVITHSIGGQILAFNPYYKLIDNVITVASQSGYWKLWKGLSKLKMNIYWNAMIPIATKAFGYFPAKKMGLFENLPKHMVYQWRRWANHKNYMLGEFNINDTSFNKYSGSILALSFPRDGFAPKTAVDWLANQYTKATVDRRHLIPEELNIPDVKHFGFFRDTYKTSLWVMVDEWIKS